MVFKAAYLFRFIAASSYWFNINIHQKNGNTLCSLVFYASFIATFDLPTSVSAAQARIFTGL
jgi:hypothetical protein